MTTQRTIQILTKAKNIFYGFAIIFLLFAANTIFSYSSVGTGEPTDSKSSIERYGSRAIPVPDSVFFASERVPVENFDVKESLDMELHKVSYWHSEMYLYLKRANRFFPIIEPILKKNGIPDDFKYVCVAESGLTNATSPAKAVGFWQFMTSTAKSYGLEVNDEIDERYHLGKSTVAACKYLKSKYAFYKSWTLAAASYNAGDGGVKKFIEYQDEDSYFDLALYAETGRYVYRAIAIKLIMENPQKYGFNYDKKDLYPIIDTKELKVDSSISDLANFAKNYGTNYKILKLFNPWLRDRKLVNKNKKTYTLVIPDEGARSKEYFAEEKQKAVNKIVDSLIN